MAILPSPIYQSTVDSKQRLYYKPQGSDVVTQIADPTQLQTLAKQGLVEVGKPYQSYTPPPITPTAPVAPTSPTSPTAPATPPPGQTESSPGVFSSSKLTNFYNDQINLLKPQFEAATKALTDTSTALGEMKAPDFKASYDTAYASKIAPLDATITETSGKLNALDGNIRTLEDAVRAEIGGRASEASIQAEVARRAKPLLLERQGYVDQLNTFQDQRKTMLADVTQNLSFEQQSFENKNTTLKAQRDLAQNTLDAFSNIMEKGALATDRDVDNARTLFTTFLNQSPDFLKNLTEDEFKSLQNGVVPYSALSKIGETLNQQKKATPKIVGTAKTGFFEYDPNTGNFRPLTAKQAAAAGATGAGGGGTGGGAGTGGGGSSYTVKPPTFEQFIAAKEKEMQMTLSQASRDKLRPEYDALLKATQEQAPVPQKLSASYTATERRTLDRAAIGNDAAAAVFLSADPKFKTWFATTISPEAKRTGTVVTPAYMQTQLKYWTDNVANGGKVTRYNDANIPKDLRSELVQNIQGGASRTQILDAYPDVSLDYINKLYDTYLK